jgi:GTP cyclohydrolase IA
MTKKDETTNEYSRLDYNTPLRPDAFVLTDNEKIEKIEGHFLEIMKTLGLDMTDDSLKGTPKRVAKMYIKEIFSGLDARNFPKATLFENKFGYKEMLVEKDITFYSNCEHHFVPFFGKAHVAYFGADKVIGLSKLNRIVQYFARRPQVQERLTNQIGKELQIVLQTENVAVFIEASHLCVASRGIKDTNSSTITTFYGGRFVADEMKNQFLNYIS